ncbi:MAG: chloride channel protein [Bacteroidales bacterium]
MVKKSWIDRFLRWENKNISERQMLVFLSIFIGIFAAIAAVVLKTSVHYLENWVRSVPGAYMGNWLFLLFPVIGILITVLYVNRFIREDISHGVSNILHAISRNKGVMKLHNIYSSIIACTFTGGLGGSVGMEAPIVSTGAAIGSNIAKSAKMGFRRTSLLIGCGAAAAIAAIFKAPIAGLIFSLEVLKLDLTMTSLMPLLVAAVVGTIFSSLFLGEQVDFHFTLQDPFNYSHIPLYILLGIITGLVSLYFIWVNEQVETKVGRIGPTYLRVLYGGILLGVLIFLFPPLFGEGYYSMRGILSGQPEQLLDDSFYGHLIESGSMLFIGFMVLVLFFKAIATSLTIGAGGVGGVFAPSLFMGGIAGFIFSRTANFFSNLNISENNFTLVGMAGLIAGVIHAPLTAVFLIAEITGGYELIIPLILVASISYMTVIYFKPFSLYEKRLGEKGHLITHHKDHAVLTLLNVENVLETNFDQLLPDQTLGDLVKVIARASRNIFPVIDDQKRFLGLVRLDDVREIMFDQSQYDKLTVRDLMIQPRATVNSSDSMETVMHKFRNSGLWNMAVVDNGKYKGFVSRANVFNIYRKMLIEVSDV